MPEATRTPWPPPVPGGTAAWCRSRRNVVVLVRRSRLDPVEDPTTARFEKDEREAEHDGKQKPQQRRAVTKELFHEDLEVGVHRVEVVVPRWDRPRTQAKDPRREEHRLHQDLQRRDDPGHEIEEDHR